MRIKEELDGPHVGWLARCLGCDWRMEVKADWPDEITHDQFEPVRLAAVQHALETYHELECFVKYHIGPNRKAGS